MMKFSQNTIPKTSGQLNDAFVFTQANATLGEFPEWCGLDFDGAFERLRLGIENMRLKFGDAKSDQLLDMLSQAKLHLEEGHKNGGKEDQPSFKQIKLGTWLMLDCEEVIYDKPPYAYPEEIYRWPYSEHLQATEMP